MEGIRKEAIVILHHVLSQVLPEVAEKNYEDARLRSSCMTVDI
jgi:hypothetical protein